MNIANSVQAGTFCCTELGMTVAPPGPVKSSAP
jgi:hypothetical protein